MKKTFKFTVLIFLFSNLISCDNSKKSHFENETENDKKFDSLDIVNAFRTDKSTGIDTVIASVYQNYKYKFVFKLPANWKLDKGVSQITVIKGSQLDSGLTAYVGVQENTLVGMEYNGKLTPDEKAKQINMMIEMLKQANISPIDIDVKDAYVSNKPAYKISYKFINKVDEYEIESSVVLYNFYKDGLMYTLGYSLPSMFLDDKMKNRFFRIVESFKFYEILNKNVNQ